MKKLSMQLLADTVVSRRKAMKLTQAQLAEKTGIHRGLLSRLESQDFTPSIAQLQALAEVLNFEPTELFVDTSSAVSIPIDRPYHIAVAGTGYVGLSLAVLLAQHNHVTAVDIIPEKVEKLNRFLSPIQDEYIEKYLAEARAGTRKLDLSATTDGAEAYAGADFIVVAAPTNYDPKQNFFDCSAVESVLTLIRDATAGRETKPAVVIKSTIPVGYTVQIRKKLEMDNILFSPEFLRESKALYDNLYPSRIIVGCDAQTAEAARTFAGLLQQGAKKVFAIDVGYGQLAWSIRSDPRVVVMERTNIRNVTPEMLGEPLDLSVVDVSFISLRLVLPVIRDLLGPDGQVLCLIKPQFEAGKDKVGKKGVVRDIKTHIEVLDQFLETAGNLGFTVVDLTYSPVKGPEGNIEFLGHLSRKPVPVREFSPESVAMEAHEKLKG